MDTDAGESGILYFFRREKFSLVSTVKNTVPDKDETVQIKIFLSQVIKPVKAKFIKVKAINYGKLPVWHASAGADAYIFIDEISIE